MLRLPALTVPAGSSFPDVPGDLAADLSTVSHGVSPVKSSPDPRVVDFAHERVHVAIGPFRLHDLGSGGTVALRLAIGDAGEIDCILRIHIRDNTTALRSRGQVLPPVTPVSSAAGRHPTRRAR